MAVRPRRVQWILAAVCAVYVALSGVYMALIPPGYGPDEPRHQRYYEWIYSTGTLPQSEATTGAIVHHPPLYYLLCVPCYALVRHAGEGAIYFMRALSTALGIVVILLTYRLVQTALAQPAPALFGAAATALCPHFLLISAVVSNDMLASVFGSLTLLLGATLALRGASVWRCAVAGAVLGLGCLTKHSVVALAPMLIPAVAVGVWGHREPLTDEDAAGPARRGPVERFLLGGAALGAACLVIGGWRLVGFYLTYGRLDSDPAWPLSSWPDPAVHARLSRAFWGLFRSAWIQVDWLPPVSQPLIYGALGLYSAASAVGLVRLIGHAARERGLRGASALALPLLGAAALYGVLLLNATFTNPGRFEGGRYWLPAVAGYMGFWLPGLAGLLGRWWVHAAAVGLLILLAMNGLSVYWFVAFLNPTYAPG